ncbi:MAG TPA: class I poly(R)-hydroxyalkanoic acid synthase [Burkholderiaceae bacterium]|nr:class I poly(R)-hydroxyalkanoic acid synthase [Burkholderiaceae bacterium]
MDPFSSSAWPSMSIPVTELNAIRERFMQAWAGLQEQVSQGQLEAPADRRFRDAAWSANPVFAGLAHAYLLGSQALEELVDAAQVDDATRERLRFNVMQWTQAMSPANFLLTNPQAQQKALETGGQSIAQGVQQLFTDLQKGRMTQTDEDAFQVGINVAITPGHVIFENALMQVIQYTPQTSQVYSRPLVIVPPCINKYYILDLQPDNSFVNYAVEQGFTVFLVSWRNPLATDTDHIQRATWGDYLQHGVLTAIDMVRQFSGQDQVNALGFCVGGTMLTSALALARGQGRQPVHSLTLLTSLLDFTTAGVLNVFVDEQHASLRDLQLGSGGLMPARELATTFSFLRPGELVWNYVSSNYLMGEAPPAFDLLYWNADGTNLPGPFFAWYFRNTYLENNLATPGKVVIDGIPLDFSTINVPAYVYASREDHIVPWQGAYDSMHLLRGQRRFVMGASGHIAGVINHPSRGRRSYWVLADAVAPGQPAPSVDDAETAATEYAGSWWPDWIQWLSTYSGHLVTPPAQPGSPAFPVIEPAPGRYVLVKAEP